MKALSERLELITLIAERKAQRAWNQKSIDDNLPVWGSDPVRKVAKLDAEIQELEKQLELRYPIAPRQSTSILSKMSDDEYERVGNI
jgi:hypothetical protein